MLLRVACCSMSFEALNTWVFIKVEISILYRPIWFYGLNIDMSHKLYIGTREYHLTRNTQAGVLCVYDCQKNKPSNECMITYCTFTFHRHIQANSRYMPSISTRLSLTYIRQFTSGSPCITCVYLELEIILWCSLHIYMPDSWCCSCCIRPMWMIKWDEAPFSRQM